MSETRRNGWRERVRALKEEVYALYLATRDSETPWYAKVVALSAVAYALSPIDLIPDFIPVLGQLDDLLLVPLGIFVALKLIPVAVMERARQKAAQQIEIGVPEARWVAAVIVLLWVLTSVWLILKITALWR